MEGTTQRKRGGPRKKGHNVSGIGRSGDGKTWWNDVKKAEEYGRTMGAEYDGKGVGS